MDRKTESTKLYKVEMLFYRGSSWSDCSQREWGELDQARAWLDHHERSLAGSIPFAHRIVLVERRVITEETRTPVPEPEPKWEAGCDYNFRGDGGAVWVGAVVYHCAAVSDRDEGLLWWVSPIDTSLLHCVWMPATSAKSHVKVEK
jgi:hypothetical protein